MLIDGLSGNATAPTEDNLCQTEPHKRPASMASRCCSPSVVVALPKHSALSKEARAGYPKHQIYSSSKGSVYPDLIPSELIYSFILPPDASRQLRLPG